MKPSQMLIRTAAAVTAALRKRPFLRMAFTRVGPGDLRGVQRYQGKFNAMPGTLAAPTGMGDAPGTYGMNAQVARAGTVRRVVPGAAFGSDRANFSNYVWNAVWNYVDVAFDDNENRQYVASNLMDSASFQAQVEAVCDHIEQEAIRAIIQEATVFQKCGTNGFADSEANFDTEWRQGLGVQLSENGAYGDLYGLLNPADHGQLKSVDGVSAADQRGDMGAAARMDVQQFDGVYWLMSNNIPGMADSFSGAPLVNGAQAAGDAEIAVDGGATVRSGAIVTFGTAERYLVKKVTENADGQATSLTIDRGLVANVADNTAVAAVNDQISIVASKRCMGYAPMMIEPDADDQNFVALQDMGTPQQPGTGMGVYIERNRATVARSNYIFSGALAAGMINADGVGILLPA